MSGRAALLNFYRLHVMHVLTDVDRFPVVSVVLGGKRLSVNRCLRMHTFIEATGTVGLNVSVEMHLNMNWHAHRRVCADR